MILGWSAGCMTCQGDGWDSALLALLSSELWDEANREVSMQILPTFVLSSVDFQPSLSAGEKKETAARVRLVLSSFQQKNIKICLLNSERFRDWCRYNLGKNKTNKRKRNSLLLFDTCFWVSAQSQPRLTWLNLSADSDSKEQGPPASHWKNISIEIRNYCEGRRKKRKLSCDSLKLQTIMQDSLLFQP